MINLKFLITLLIPLLFYTKVPHHGVI